MSSSQLKAELEELYTNPSNSQCFDCDNKPAHWASINNGIYLCLDCSGEHRGFGVSCSYIKSVTLDQWTATQVAFMKVGGNDRLKTFLLSHDMPDYLDKKTIYCSKLMSYYRRMLKAEANGEMFCEPMPRQENYWDESSKDEIDNNSKYTNNLFSNRNFNNNNKKNNSNYSSSYPKSEIVISEDQYERARNYAETASRYTNTVPSEPKFAKVDPKYKNDSRFASIGSEPVDNNDGYFSGYGSYLGSVGSFLGGVWNVGTGVASAVKDKMAEYDVGNKLLYVGGAAVSALAYTGGKILEKGSEVIHSETAANLAEKAGDGLSYIKSKIVGGSSSSNYKYGSKGNYSSTSSDDYYDRY
jgi:hypothetical protein